MRVMEHSPNGAAGCNARPSLDIELSVWSSTADGSRAGGDWCGVFETSRRLLAATIGDVSGHGSAVAGTMTQMSTAVRGALLEDSGPSAALTVANDVASRIDQGVIVTAIAAVIDRQAATLTFANAGHPPPLFITAGGGRFAQPSIADLPLGVFTSASFEQHTVSLVPHSLLVLYTDGITEHRRDPIRGEEELLDAAAAVYAHPRLNAARAIARRVFNVDRGDDDAAIIALRVHQK